MFDEELPKKKLPGVFPRNLESMSVDELEAYVRDMEQEIVRVRADISRKKASQEAAAAIFKS